MIKTKSDLQECLSFEKSLYLSNGLLNEWLVNTKDYSIYKYQVYLRKEEFYGNNLNSIFNKICYVWYKRKKNILGQKLGFDIPMNCFDFGLHIHHVGPVTVNAEARIGKNCDITGNVCIGKAGKSLGVDGGGTFFPRK